MFFHKWNTSDFLYSLKAECIHWIYSLRHNPVVPMSYSQSMHIRVTAKKPQSVAHNLKLNLYVISFPLLIED